MATSDTMNIIIDLGDDISVEAESRNRESLAYASTYKTEFTGVTFTVQRGDFTQVDASGSHDQLELLLAFVHRLAEEDESFEKDGRRYLPMPGGGFLSVRPEAGPPNA